MSIRFSLGNRLFRAAVLFGFLGCLLAAGIVSSRAANRSMGPSEALTNAVAATSTFGISLCVNPNTNSDLKLSVQEIGLLDEFGVVLEDDDSIEMLRVDLQQRTHRLDRAMVGPRVALKAAESTRPSISLPLLV